MRLIAAAVLTFALASNASAGEELACPAPLRGAQLVVVPTSGGVTLRITTPERGHVDTVRALVREMAVIVEQHAASRPDDPDMIPPVRMRVTDVRGGTLVTARPRNPRDLARVRKHAQLVAGFWAEWPCVNDYMPPVARTIRL